MLSKIRLFLKISIISLIISIIIIPFRGISFGWLDECSFPSIVGFITYYILTMWMLLKYSKKKSSLFVIICIFIGVSVLNLPFHVIHFNATLISLPEYLIHILAIVLAYTCYKFKNQKIKVVMTLFSLLIGMYLSIPFYGMWLNHLNYNTFTGKILVKNTRDIVFLNSQGDNLTLESFKGKYLVLDFWHTYCGVCYKKMPTFEKNYLKYKDNPEVIISSLHGRFVSEGETFGKGDSILHKKGFVFPALSINIEDSIFRQVIGYTKFPVALIFDKNSNLVFKGNIDDMESFVDKKLKETENDTQ